MKNIQLATASEELVLEVELAETSIERMRGLLGRKMLAAGRAMWFRRCRSVHTFFMRFSLDLIFLDENMRVTCVNRGVPPWRAVIGPAGSSSVLEMQAGWLESMDVGQNLSIRQAQESEAVSEL